MLSSIDINHRKLLGSEIEKQNDFLTGKCFILKMCEIIIYLSIMYTKGRRTKVIL